MSAPIHLLLMLMKHMTWICMIIVTSLIVLNFVYTLHTELTTARQRLMDDQWLLEKCGEPDFYMRLKQHTDLCEGVEANARRSILLHSFTAALGSAQLCGFDSCVNIANAIVDVILRGGLITVSVAVAIMFVLPTLFIIMYRRFVDSVAETHLKHKYNMPYGLNTSLIHCHQDQAFVEGYNQPRAITQFTHM